MKKLLSILFLAFMACTMSMAQDFCDVIAQTIQEAKTLVSQGNTSRALNMLKRAQNIPELKECPNYSRLADEIRRIESRQQSSSSGSSSPSVGQNLTITANGVTFTMVAVQGGTFQMGATAEQGSDAYDGEKPAHQVTLSDYYIGQTEVTQALWQAVMGSNPSNWKGNNLPVETVSWNDCQQFITKLNQLTGRKFRLPTEAEWEYAARGGNKSRGYKYAGSNDLGSVAWYVGNSGSKTHPVGQKQANELGIYDMACNVYEWCQDWYGSYSSGAQTNPMGPSSASLRVNRGGCWFSIARCCRVSYRLNNNPDRRDNFLGLRLAL
jgi:formylglycine-generating enzyme required for sulfatase activity